MKKDETEEDFAKAKETYDKKDRKTKEVNKLSERAQKTTGKENIEVVREARKAADS